MFPLIGRSHSRSLGTRFIHVCPWTRNGSLVSDSSSVQSHIHHRQFPILMWISFLFSGTICLLGPGNTFNFGILYLISTDSRKRMAPSPLIDYAFLEDLLHEKEKVQIALSVLIFLYIRKRKFQLFLNFKMFFLFLIYIHLHHREWVR